MNTEFKCSCCDKGIITSDKNKEFLCMNCGIFYMGVREETRKQVIEEVMKLIDKKLSFTAPETYGHMKLKELKQELLEGKQ